LNLQNLPAKTAKQTKKFKGEFESKSSYPFCVFAVIKDVYSQVRDAFQKQKG
jgi:hypothetical protein